MEEIHSGRVSKGGARVDRILRPERHSAGEFPDVGQVEREIPEVIHREDLDFVSVSKHDPKKCPKGKEDKGDEDGPFPRA